LESESPGPGVELCFLLFLVPELIAGKSAVIELVVGGDEVKDDPGVKGGMTGDHQGGGKGDH
jgi:hypothetical protein